MATLREVKKRIRSVDNTRRITKAMEMVAAAKLRRAQQRVEQSRPYQDKLNEMLSHLALASTEDISHPYFEARQPKRRTVVVFTSDRGLCGSYNANVIRRSGLWLRENNDCETELVLVGKKANDFFKRRPTPIVAYFGDWSGVIAFDKARAIVNLLTERFVTGQTDEIVLIYTRFLSMVKYRLVVETYLPIPKPEIRKDQDVPTVAQGGYIFEPHPEAIYAALMPSYATAAMIMALAESFASEHGSRMIAMGNATANAEDLSGQLTLDYNKARQAAITKELLEVVSGAEALKSS